MKGTLLLVGSSQRGVCIEDGELKGRDEGSKITFRGQKSHFEVRTQAQGQGNEGHTWGSKVTP